MDTSSTRTWYVDPAGEDAMAVGHGPVWRHFIDLIREKDLATSVVLDYGCNQGGFLRLLNAVRPFRRALGVDLARDSVDKANRLKGDLPAQYEVGSALVGWDNTFDLATSHEVIYLIGDLEEHARTIRRVLKPGGVYYAVTGCHTDNPLWREWRTLVAEQTTGVFQERSISDYAQTFAAAGFAVSARRFALNDFVPFHTSRWMPTLNDALRYYAETKIIFRLVKPADSGRPATVPGAAHN